MNAETRTNRTSRGRHGPLNRLLERVARHDESALADLYDATSAWVYGLALRILGDATASEEVTVDVFHQAWHRAPSFDARRGTAHAWLLAMARNRAIDRARSKAASAAHETAICDEARHPMDPRPDPETHAMLADRGRRVRTALEELSAEQREVIELAFFDGLSHGQIARRLSQPLGTVKTRIRLGVRHLAGKLLPLEDER